MLIFDFDGVLMDSVREVAVTAYNTLKGDVLLTRLDQLPQAALALFLRNRFHLQPIGDAPVLMNWCLEIATVDPEKTLSEEEYDKIVRRVDEPIVSRTTRFFEMRGRFKQKDLNAWFALNAPVQPLWALLVERQGKGLVMLTNKNREATTALCRHFGLEIDGDDVYAGDGGTTKIDNMQKIMQRFREDRTYAFIDDSVRNLREIDAYFNKGDRVVELLFATWGYTGPNDARFAASFGYRALAMDELMQSLRRNLLFSRMPDR
jgi:phosphoglycolate phosphatase-like HAD superfamily hydrolase